MTSNERKGSMDYIDKAVNAVRGNNKPEVAQAYALIAIAEELRKHTELLEEHRGK